MKSNLILIGGGGHCKSCIDVIETTGSYDIIGILDVEEKIGEYILDYKVIGTDEDISKYKSDTNYFFITIGQIGLPNKRAEIYNFLKDENCNLATIISSKAYISKYAEVSEGTFVGHGVIINADAKVGVNCIINSKSLIEHDASIGNHCHISTGAIVNGGTTVEDNVFYGSGAVCKQGAIIKENSFIKANSIIK